MANLINRFSATGIYTSHVTVEVSLYERYPILFNGKVTRIVTLKFYYKVGSEDKVLAGVEKTTGNLVRFNYERLKDNTKYELFVEATFGEATDLKTVDVLTKTESTSAEEPEEETTTKKKPVITARPSYGRLEVTISGYEVPVAYRGYISIYANHDNAEWYEYVGTTQILDIASRDISFSVAIPEGMVIDFEDVIKLIFLDTSKKNVHDIQTTMI